MRPHITFSLINGQISFPGKGYTYWVLFHSHILSINTFNVNTRISGTIPVPKRYFYLPSLCSSNNVYFPGISQILCLWGNSESYNHLTFSFPMHLRKWAYNCLTPVPRNFSRDQCNSEHFYQSFNCFLSIHASKYP